MAKFHHFPTPNGINNALRIGGKGSLTAKHNFDHVAVPVGYEYEKESDNLTITNEITIEKPIDTKPFNYVSLFSGIGGFEQALNKLGGTCVLASEIDKFAEKSYQALYGHETVGDITKVDAKDVPNHDILTAGFPCQSFSVAGKRGGFEDARGTLFFEIARIAAEKQPKVLLLENVKGLVGHDKGRTLDTIVKTLNDIGYRVDFNVLNSKYFGVPQNRERIFIVGIREDLIENESWNNTQGNTVVPKGKRRISEYDDVKTFNFDFPEQGEVTTRLRDILETEVDEKYYLSEDKTAKLVAQLEARDQEVGEEATPMNVLSRGAETKTDGTSYCLKAGRQQELIEPKIDVVGRLELSKNDRTNRIHSVDGLSPTPSGLGQGGGTEPKIAEPQMLGRVDLRGNDQIRRVYSPTGVAPTGVAPTLTTMQGGHQEPKIAEEQGLPIREATKKGYTTAAVGDAVNFQFPDSKTRRGRVGKQIANTLEASSINQGVVEAEEQSQEVRPVLTPDRLEKRQNGRRFKEDGEESFTLTAQDRHGVATGNPPRYRIRKLTPLECFRLQGFSDEAHQTLVDAGISDSQRYKQAGNAVTVNVIEAIGERLLPYLA